MSKFRLATIGLSLGMGILFLVGGCGPKPIAKVNGTAISRDEFTAALEHGIGLRESFTAGKQTLDMLIVMKLVEKDAKEKGISVSDAELKKALDVEKKNFQSPDGSSYEDALKKAGIPMEEYKKQKRFDLLLEKLVVTNSEVEQAFKAYASQLGEKENISFIRMVLPNEDTAQRAYKKITTDKQDFTKVSAELSVPGLQDNQILQMEKGSSALAVGSQKALAIKLESTLFATPVGQVTKPFSISEPGPRASATEPEKMVTMWIVAKVLTHKPAQKATLENSRDKIRKELLKQKATQSGGGEVQQYLTSLRAKARLEIIDPNYSTLQEQYTEASKAMPQFVPPKPSEAPSTAPMTGGGQ